jgi:phosphoribosyl 1,2-cyclic phosphate phosphodiesterase
MPTLGLRIGDLAYCTDVVRFTPEAFAALRHVRTWVVGCRAGGAPHPTHANLDQVLAWVAELQPERTILTHMGPDMDWARVGAILPAWVEMGWDGMVLDQAARS